MDIKRKYFFIFKGENPAKKNSRRTLLNGKTIPSRRFEAWHADSLFSILDLLQDGLVIADDNWQIVRKICIINRYEKNNPHCEITLFDYKEKELKNECDSHNLI